MEPERLPQSERGQYGAEASCSVDAISTECMSIRSCSDLLEELLRAGIWRRWRSSEVQLDMHRNDEQETS